MMFHEKAVFPTILLKSAAEAYYISHFVNRILKNFVLRWGDLIKLITFTASSRKLA